MKIIYFSLFFLTTIIIIGIAISTKQESKSETFQKTETPIDMTDTLLVGKISFTAVFDNANYHDSDGIAISLQKSGGVSYEIVSDKNGLFYLSDIPNGQYEITKLSYKKKHTNRELFYVLTLRLFFEVTKGKINNSGMIEWNYDKTQNAKHSPYYQLIKNEFEAAHGLQKKEWINISLSEWAPLPDKRAKFDDENWDIALLDTAGYLDYLTAVEKDVILEMNKVRSNPKKYADLYIKPMLEHYKGTLYAPPNRLPAKTVEGIKAAQECYDVLLKTPAANILTPNKKLSLAAKDHAKDQSQTGDIGHIGKDGSDFFERIKRYGKNYKLVGENIAYGPNTGREIVVGLLIDDGVLSRGHRDNILHKNYNQAGVATATHRQYGVMCVIDYAEIL